MAEKRIRNLNPEEIECRVGVITEQGITLLLYKNARVDQTILDEAFGICGWQRRHNMIGNELYCILSIWDDEKKQWVQKEDVGTESDYEKAKGAASDSFKRACFNIGIGRELYSAPFIYIPINKVRMGEKNGRKSVKDSFSVKMIQTSADKVITALEIVNQRSERCLAIRCQKQLPYKWQILRVRKRKSREYQRGKFRFCMRSLEEQGLLCSRS